MVPEDRSDISDQRDRQDIADPVDSAEPTDRTDPTEPILPTDATDPMLAIDSTDPRQPIEHSESVDHRDRREEPTEVITPSSPSPEGHRTSTRSACTQPSLPMKPGRAGTMTRAGWLPYQTHSDWSR